MSIRFKASKFSQAVKLGFTAGGCEVMSALEMNGIYSSICHTIGGTLYPNVVKVWSDKGHVGWTSLSNVCWFQFEDDYKIEESEGTSTVIKNDKIVGTFPTQRTPEQISKNIEHKQPLTNAEKVVDEQRHIGQPGPSPSRDRAKQKA